VDVVFTISNLIVLPFWFLMIVLPKWSVTLRVMRSPFILLPLLILYLVCVVPLLPEIAPALVQPSLPAIAAVLGRPEVAAVAWLHLLSFDFFVGRWVYLDSRRKGRGALLMAPVLFFTLMLGPVGLLLHLLLDGLSRSSSQPLDPSETSAAERN
jgi:hypothetical protein